MEQFIGTKIINAKQMGRLEYNQFRGWELPADENGADDGFLVEYVDGGAANTTEYAGYISWSPSEVFQNAYKSSGELSFGDALVYLKDGKKVARKGWNGKGIFIQLKNPSPDSDMTNSYIFIDTTGLVSDNEFAPKSLVPWLASQTDMLAQDWVVL